MSDSESAPVYTRRFWAKSEPRHGYPKRIHLLEHHLADVGACFEALLQQPTIRRRLASTGGQADLHDETRARLCVLAALHDIGKVNMGFQTQIWRDVDVPPGQRKPRWASHTADLAPVLNGKDRATNSWFFDALDWWREATDSWDDCGGETVCAMLIATLSHHGTPLQLESPLDANPTAWHPFNNLDPQGYTKRIGQLVRQWFPDAFAPGAPPLPSAPAFQHHYLGLCVLADWIGSNEEWFKYRGEPDDDYINHARRQAQLAMKKIGLDIAEQRHVFKAAPTKTAFADLFAIPGAPPPNAIQQAAYDTPLTGQLVIIESETGSGKTEAALWRFARMYEACLVDGLYFALPTRAAASQIHRRVKDFVERMFPERNRPAVVLAVPGYEAGAGQTELPIYSDHSAGHHEHESDKPWASESPKRYLAAQIAVGTVDQAMLGALQVRHAHLRSSCLARNLLVVDEVHASDTYMTEILQGLLKAHTQAGGYALLMSATLGSAARQRWLSPEVREGDRKDLPLDQAIRAPYPAISAPGNPEPTSAGENDRHKPVEIRPLPEMADFDATAQLALDAARNEAKVLVIRNTVGHALQTHLALEAAASDADRRLLFSANGFATLHHSRFGRGDRRLLDAAVEQRLGKERDSGGCIVIGTQTLEQSLDIDADLLITDLCPVDVLLQRIGRLHRHRRDDRPQGFTTPACVVLTPSGADLLPLLTRGQNANGLGPHGYVYRSLHTLEATRRLVNEYAVWDIPKMNRRLVERATHPAALKQITEELGDAWQAHAISNEGGYIAERQTARNHIIGFDQSFFEDNREVCFPGIEESVRTRLGDDRLEVVFNPQPPSPFDPGRSIDRLDLPLRWLGGAEIPESVATTAASEGFEFSIGNRRFKYDRLGLRGV